MMFLDSLEEFSQLAWSTRCVNCTPFAAHGFNRLSRRPNEGQASFRAFLCEVWVLTQLGIISFQVAVPGFG
jgi:hypothetical protein